MRMFFSIPLGNALVFFLATLPISKTGGTKVSWHAAIRLVRMSFVARRPWQHNLFLQINAANRDFLGPFLFSVLAAHLPFGCVSLLALQLTLASVAVILRAIVRMSVLKDAGLAPATSPTSSSLAKFVFLFPLQQLCSTRT